MNIKILKKRTTDKQDTQEHLLKHQTHKVCNIFKSDKLSKKIPERLQL